MKFYNWLGNTLYIQGVIDEYQVEALEKQLKNLDSDIIIWINSSGGDCIAAARIYNALINYKHKVTIKIDGICASAATVIAMGGDKIFISPVSLFMIHNPLTMTAGEVKDMKKSIEILESVKESIINAYEIKTKLNRSVLSEMMDKETWMDAKKSVELGFADGILQSKNNIIDELNERLDLLNNWR